MMIDIFSNKRLDLSSKEICRSSMAIPTQPLLLVGTEKRREKVVVLRELQ
jgi:hypothetical protein